MTTSSKLDLESEFARVAASREVRSSTASERVAAVASARGEIEQLAERERARLRRALADVDKSFELARVELEQAAEGARRARADALLADAFSKRDGSLASLVAQWRVEPSRLLTNALLACWRELDARCSLEVGEPLALHTLACAFIDSIAPSFPRGSITHLAGFDVGFGVCHRTVEALGAWARADDPGAASAALDALEASLTALARRGRDATVEERHLELLALHRSCATTRDLMLACAAHDAKWARIDREQHAREFVAPPPPPLLPPAREPSLVERFWGR